MPRKPRKMKRTTQIDFLGEIHLLKGCCLIGSGCAICYGNHNFSPTGETWKLRPEAADHWRRNRDRLLAIWHQPYQGRLPPSLGPEDMAGLGNGGEMPAWAEVHFDGRDLPPLDPDWPEPVQRAWRNIAGELEE